MMTEHIQVFAFAGRSISHAVLLRLSLMIGPPLVLSLAPPVGAQESPPYLHIIQPSEWRDGNTAIVPAGRSVTIKGVAGHPSGVLKVLVNGEEAFLQRDAEYPDLFNFEKVIVATDTARDVIIVVVPRISEPYQRKYRLEGSPQPPAPQGDRRSPDSLRTTAADSASPVRVTEPERGEIDQSDAQRSDFLDPWRGFRKRGFAYGAAGISGVVLGTLKKSTNEKVCETRPAGYDCVNRTEKTAAYLVPGAVLLGGALMGTIIDAVMTSKKARAFSESRSTSGRSPGSGLRLDQPVLEPSGTGIRLQLIRLRF